MTAAVLANGTSATRPGHWAGARASISLGKRQGRRCRKCPVAPGLTRRAAGPSTAAAGPSLLPARPLAPVPPPDAVLRRRRPRLRGPARPPVVQDLVEPNEQPGSLHAGPRSPGTAAMSRSLPLSRAIELPRCWPPRGLETTRPHLPRRRSSASPRRRLQPPRGAQRGGTLALVPRRRPRGRGCHVDAGQAPAGGGVGRPHWRPVGNHHCVERGASADDPSGVGHGGWRPLPPGRRAAPDHRFPPRRRAMLRPVL